MTSPVAIHFREMSSEGLAAFEGRIAVLIDPSGKPDSTVRPLNRLVKGAIERFASSEAFEKMKPLIWLGPPGSRRRRFRW